MVYVMQCKQKNWSFVLGRNNRIQIRIWIRIREIDYLVHLPGNESAAHNQTRGPDSRKHPKTVYWV